MTDEAAQATTTPADNDSNDIPPLFLDALSLLHRLCAERWHVLSYSTEQLSATYQHINLHLGRKP